MSTQITFRIVRNGQPESPYIHLADPARDLAHLDRPHEVVIDEPDITIEYKYPLSEPVRFQYHSEGGFTRSQLVRLISDTYQRMYAEEERTSSIRPAQIHPNLLNRNETSGRFGIWGHFLNDLDLVAVQYDPKTRVCQLEIES